jgi:hypothetical protein
MTDVGSITVDDDGNATGDGLAFALFEGMLSGATAENKAAVASSMAAPMLGLAEAIADGMHPIGSIYETVQSGNPRDLLGFGAWVVFGTGRVLVGYDSGDSDFNAPEKTSGSKTHYHETPFTCDDTYLYRTAKTLFGTGTSRQLEKYLEMSDDETASTNVMVTEAVSSVQPSIVVYRWKRTA